MFEYQKRCRMEGTPGIWLMRGYDLKNTLFSDFEMQKMYAAIFFPPVHHFYFLCMKEPKEHSPVSGRDEKIPFISSSIILKWRTKNSFFFIKLKIEIKQRPKNFFRAQIQLLRKKYMKNISLNTKKNYWLEEIQPRDLSGGIIQ